YFEREIAPHVDGDRVRYVGSLGPAERDELLGSALALLPLVEFAERFGLSMIEAMACGTPVIARGRRGVGEVVVEGWTGFGGDGVDGDFARIRDAGGDLVRFFLLWEDFQPQPTSVSDRSLALLVTVADTAWRHGLQVIPTLFTGHMSGANFVPLWALASNTQR